MKRLKWPRLARNVYWRYQQRAMSIRSWSELAAAEGCAGASIAIVGSAGYLRGLRQGAKIDSYDIVLRMNNFRLDGFHAEVGSRVDIAMSNFYPAEIDFSNPALRGVRMIASSRPNTFRRRRGARGVHLAFGEHITEGMKALGRTTAYAPDVEYFRRITDEFGACPTSGAMSILLVHDFLAAHCGSVYLTGFSFFEGKGYYFNDRQAVTTTHNVAEEKRLLGERLAGWMKTGQVELDPVMAGILERSSIDEGRSVVA